MSHFCRISASVVIEISQRVAIVRHYTGQLGLHVADGQRCRQDEAVDR